MFIDLSCCKIPVYIIFIESTNPLENWVYFNEKQASPIQVSQQVNIIHGLTIPMVMIVLVKQDVILNCYDDF